MEGGSDVARSIFDEIHSSDIEGGQMEGEMVFLKLPLGNFILGLSKEAKWKVKAWCYSKYH